MKEGESYSYFSFYLFFLGGYAFLFSLGNKGGIKEGEFSVFVFTTNRKIARIYLSDSNVFSSLLEMFIFSSENMIMQIHIEMLLNVF